MTAAGISLAIIAVVGLVVSVWAEIPLAWGLAIVAVALLANGVLATVEDDCSVPLCCQDVRAGGNRVR